MSKANITSLILVLALCGCDANLQPTEADVSSQSEPIINGTRVTGNDYLATVGLVLIQSGQVQGTFCTGTLITPEYVLTAGHCISDCPDDKESNIAKRPYMYVGIGQNQDSYKGVFQIESFHPHPQFECSPGLLHDIGLIKLKEPVPLSLAVPVPPLPPELALAVADVDSTAGVAATSVGFGKTKANDDKTVGVKYMTTRNVYATCPLKGTGSKKCADSEYTAKKGILYLDASKSATCTGDSGGPTFIAKNGHDYVAGVTSYGFTNCTIVNGMTLVSDYYDFISGIVDGLPAASGEDCFNKADDNGDGRTDCDDPHCYFEISCIPEDCFNKVDDNGNGKVDCNDPQCANVIGCQTETEICDDKKDNNHDGLIDCADPTCSGAVVCQKEVCDDGIDNNGNGLIDCLDSQCVLFAACKQENCTNKVDDDGDGAVDCLDTDCKDKPVCQAETCDDGIDNNGNGLIDCNEQTCASALNCQQEICNDKVDNNGNGLSDCFDPQCATSTFCQPEICDDGIDNNGDGLKDCDDPNCGLVCNDSDGGCSAAPSSHSVSSWWWLFLAFLPLAGRRRKPDVH
ncbi:MAG: S1 family peptidase [Proteobacteria bacterium]|nr:S1 family peptidase [Pseudomonadota bacterium]